MNRIKYQAGIVFLALFLVFRIPLVAFADVNDLLISTDSNAVMTLVLDDEDYGVSTYSSLGTVSNTVKPDNLRAYVTYSDYGGRKSSEFVDLEYDGSRFTVFKDFGEDFYVTDFALVLGSGSLPSPGSYLFSFDYSSDFSYDVLNASLYSLKPNSNAAFDEGFLYPEYETFSGDVYISPYELNVTNVSQFQINTYIHGTETHGIAGNFAFRFVKSSISADAPSTAGTDTSSEDYQSDVSSSLSDLSSSVDTMTDEISGVTEAIQNLQGAMEPHYSNVLTQLHHITEQLHAFYDQVYNNIHLAQMNLLGQIKTAIENIDLEVEVNLDKLKASIDNMSTAIQGKLQSTTDQITGGYDNSGITQENEKLEQSINQYDEVESGIFEDAEGFIGDFEYPSVDSLPLGIIKALAFVGSFLQGIFLSMGEFSVIITFSLTMIFVMVVVGYHRIRS